MISSALNLDSSEVEAILFFIKFFETESFLNDLLLFSL